MAFSFTPGQIAPQGGQVAPAPGTGAPGMSLAPTAGPPSNSPFLILRERGQPLSLLACVQVVLLTVTIVSVALTVILYSYTIYLTSSIDKKKTTIAEKETSFKVYPFEDMKQLSLRLQTLDTLLKGYVSPRSPFVFLEDVVENEVYFNDFSLTRHPSGYIVDFTVLTKNYVPLIQQLESLNFKQYTKIVPKLSASGFQDSSTLIKIKVTTPIVVQGTLPKNLNFIEKEPSTTTGTTVESQVKETKP